MAHYYNEASVLIDYKDTGIVSVNVSPSLGICSDLINVGNVPFTA